MNVSRAVPDLSIESLCRVVAPFDFPLVVLFGSTIAFLKNIGTPAPHDIDLLVRVRSASSKYCRGFYIDDAGRLDDLSKKVSTSFGIPCSIHAFEGDKPDDLVGLIALRDGTPVYVSEDCRNTIPEVSEFDLSEARKRLYDMAIGMLERLRDHPVNSMPYPIPKSRNYQLNDTEDMVDALLRYERLELEVEKIKELEELSFFDNGIGYD